MPLLPADCEFLSKLQHTTALSDSYSVALATLHSTAEPSTREQWGKCWFLFSLNIWGALCHTKTIRAKNALSFHIEEMALVANMFSRHYINKITFQFLTSRVIGLFRNLHCGSTHKPIKCNNKPMILRRLLFSPCRTLDSRIKMFCDKISLGMVGAWAVERKHSVHSFLII